jgi:hypothetical protein
MAIFLPAAVLAAEEAVGELIGAGIEDATGGPDIGEQALIEDPETRPFFLAAAASGPGLALAMDRILEAVKSGRATDDVVTQLARNFGVADKADDLRRFARYATTAQDKAEALVKTAKTLPESSFLKQSRPVREFIQTEADKALTGARRAAGSAQGRFKRLAQALGAEADTVTGAPVALIEDQTARGIPRVPGTPPDLPIDPPAIPDEAKFGTKPGVIPSELRQAEVPGKIDQPKIRFSGPLPESQVGKMSSPELARGIDDLTKELAKSQKEASKAGRKETAKKIAKGTVDKTKGLFTGGLKSLRNMGALGKTVSALGLGGLGLGTYLLLSGRNQDEVPASNVDAERAARLEEALKEEQARRIIEQSLLRQTGQKPSRATDQNIEDLERIRKEILELGR